MRETYEESCKSLTEALAKWEELKKTDLAGLNGTLGDKAVAAPPALAAPGCGK
jgi:hypothetical protein